MPLSKTSARADLVDCRIEDIGDRIFAVTRVPLDAVKVVADWEYSADMWITPTKGTDPVAALADTGDPQTQARMIERHHDYPSPNMLGHFIAD